MMQFEVSVFAPEATVFAAHVENFAYESQRFFLERRKSAVFDSKLQIKKSVAAPVSPQAPLPDAENALENFSKPKKELGLILSALVLPVAGFERNFDPRSKSARFSAG